MASDSGSGAPSSELWQIRVDTGGTFTDCLADDPAGRTHRCKVLSSGTVRARLDEIPDPQTIILKAGWDLLEFTVGNSCLADTNGDGILDLGDIQTFIALFLVQDSGADFNGDGIVDLGDIQVFVNVVYSQTY